MCEIGGGPKAPKDPTRKRPGFFVMRKRQIIGAPQPDGRGVQFIYENDGRLINSAGIVGNVTDETILKLMETTEGFRKLVHSIGVTVETDAGNETILFAFQMYGKQDVYGSGTTLRMSVRGDGMEQILVLDEQEWSDDDDIPGQIRFEFETPEIQAKASVKLYLQDGFEAPEEELEEEVDLSSPYYPEMLEKSLLQLGNNIRVKRFLERARNGEDVTVSFIGGSITQGAGAVPINTECYAYKTYKGICELAGKGLHENIHYCKAGVGGTPSELGILRFERDVCEDEAGEPDLVVVEFAVNDEGDETKGECYDSLVRKIWNHPNKPAVILLFAVFANDWNLQERLACVGEAYKLPMVSTRDTVVEQFYKKAGQGKIVTKNQFFYDSYHPTNVGHTIMADGILHLLKTLDAQAYDSEEVDITTIIPPKGGDFENVKLLDRKDEFAGATIEMGDFFDTDEELQGVERNLNLTQSMEFPYNWMYRGIEGRKNQAFKLKIECKSLFIIFKDSAANTVGSAQIMVDGKDLFLANPHINGWTHCNPVICFRGKETRKHIVEVKMQPGDEAKDFTILGFGYVE